MPQRHSRVAGWFNRVFPGFVGPDLVDEIVVPTVNYYGTETLGNVTYEEVTATATNSANGSVVPEGKIRIILNSSVHHNDTGVNHVCKLGNRQHNAGLVIVWFASAPALVPGDAIFSPRHMILGPRTQIHTSFEVALQAAKKIFLRQAFVEVPIGEYVAGI